MKEPCDDCEGSGDCTYCEEEAGRHGYKIGPDCWDCEGTGDCQTCDGEGEWDPNA